MIRLPFAHIAFGGSWFTQGHVLAPDIDLNDSNRKLVAAYKGVLALDGAPTAPKATSAETHLMVSRPLREVFDSFVGQYVMYESDAAPFTALQVVLDAALERDPDAMCDIYVMGAGAPRRRALRQGTATRVDELFQGRDPNRSAQAGGYPGDSALFDPGRVTVQVHSLNVLNAPRGSVLEEHVPALAIRVPEAMATAALAQID